MNRKQESYKNWSLVGNAGGKSTNPGGVVKEVYLSAEEAKQAHPHLVDELRYQNLLGLVDVAPAGQEILKAGFDIIEMLLEKNISYGNSAISPLRLFSKAGVEEQIFVRLDDKLSRLMNNQTYPGDNDIDDLIGYLILLKVSRRQNG